MGSADASRPFREPEGRDGGHQCSLGIATPVLTDLRDLHPGHGPKHSSAIGYLEPGRLCLRVTPEPSEESSSLHDEAHWRPTRVEPIAGCGSHGRRAAGTTEATTEIGASSWRPPIIALIPDGANRRHGDGANRQFGDGADRGLDAFKGFVEASVYGEGSGETGEITRVRSAASLGITQTRFDERDEARERTYVLIVVANDLNETCGLTITKKLQVASGYLPSRDIAVSAQPEEFSLSCLKPSIGHSVAKQPSDNGQEVQMPGVNRRSIHRHPVPGDQEWPVKPLAVIGDQPAVDRDVPPKLLEQGGLVNMVREEQLDLPEARPFPPSQPDQKGKRPGGRRQSCRLGVETHERDFSGRLTRQRGEPVTIDRDDGGRPFHAHE